MAKIKYLYIILIGLFVIVTMSCSERSIEDDAREAAELTAMSNQASMDGDFGEASQTYNKVQQIMDKYKKQDKFYEFYQLYISYMHDNSYKIEEK